MRSGPGPKIVVLDREARMRRMCKKFYKETSKPGVRSITFVVEREDGVNCQSTYHDDSEAREILRKAIAVLSAW